MNYTQALAWLYNTQHSGIKLGLEQTRRLLAELGFDGRAQRFIHVAGTNGKGSVCAMLDAICRVQGIRTGLYTSPHLVSFCERVKLDGTMITEAGVTAGLVRIRDIVAGWEVHPTFFEITTALALKWFQEKEADVVVLETGLGGRLDSTNVVTPKVSVLTKVDLDHQAWLGSTLTQIASEKAGIIKAGVPVISTWQHEEVAGVFNRTATEKGAPIRFIPEPLEDVAINLAGSHQKLNAALALAALDAAGIPVSRHSIQTGLANVDWPGRFQIVQRTEAKFQNRVILDGAHNESAAQRLAMTWREIFGDEKPVIILGILKDKDMAAICQALTPIAASLVAVPVRSQRSSTAEELRGTIREVDPSVRCEIATDVSRALEIAAREHGRILITGSLFLVGEALAHFEAGGKTVHVSSQ